MGETMSARRNLLKGIGSLAAFAMFAEPTASAQPQPADRPGVLNVRDFGAKGDGKSDDTQAFQKAIDTAHAMSGNIVFVPRGDYLIVGTLDVREHVVLKGVLGASAKCWRNASREPRNSVQQSCARGITSRVFLAVR